MPELDGPTIAAVLTARQPGLPVLFMSGYPRDREGEISGPRPRVGAGQAVRCPSAGRGCAPGAGSVRFAGGRRSKGRGLGQRGRAGLTPAGASGLDDVQDVDQDVEDGQDSDHGAADAHDPADIAAHVAVFLGRADASGLWPRGRPAGSKSVTRERSRERPAGCWAARSWATIWDSSSAARASSAAERPWPGRLAGRGCWRAEERLSWCRWPDRFEPRVRLAMLVRGLR